MKGLRNIISHKIYKAEISPIVSVCFETWYLSLREKNRLKMFENKIYLDLKGMKLEDEKASE